MDGRSSFGLGRYGQRGGAGGLHMVVIAVTLVSCHRPWSCLLLDGIGVGGFSVPCYFMFIDSGSGTACSKAPFSWNLGQCLDLWMEET